MRQKFRHKQPKEHFDEWYDKLCEEYFREASDKGSFYAFSILSQFRAEIEHKMDSLKKELDLYSDMLKKILRPDEEITRDSDVYALHHEIRLLTVITFTSETVGNFMYGSSDKGYLEEKLRDYMKGTDQKVDGNLIRKAPLAYKKRFLADKLKYQILAADYLIEQLIEEDYPSDISELDDDDEAIEEFLREKKSTSGKKTPEDFLRDIYEMILEILGKNDEEMFRKNGKLIYKRAAEYALDDKDYFEKWGKKGENDEDGFSFEWHQKKFKEIYEQLFLNEA